MAYEKMPFLDVPLGVKKPLKFAAKSAQHQGEFKKGKNEGQPYWVWHLMDGNVKSSYFATMDAHDRLTDLAVKHDTIIAEGCKGYVKFTPASGVEPVETVKPTPTVAKTETVKTEPVKITYRGDWYGSDMNIRTFAFSYVKDLVVAGKVDLNNIFEFSKRVERYVVTGNEYLKEEEDVINALERPAGVKTTNVEPSVGSKGVNRGTPPDDIEFKAFLAALRSVCLSKHPGKPLEQFKETEVLMTRFLTQYYGKPSLFLMEEKTVEERDAQIMAQDGQFINYAKEELDKML
jgi:hypothetical protein